MLLTNSKWIPIGEAVIGKEYKGYRTTTGLTCWAPYKYIGNNKIQSVWHGTIEDIEDTSELEVELNDNEYRDFLKGIVDFSDPKTQLNLYGIFTDLYDIGDATHEMWNGWIETDWYRLNARISDENFTVVGVAPAPWAPDYMRKPVAIVAEEENGSRFWCHVEKSYIEKMRDNMKDVYKGMIK